MSDIQEVGAIPTYKVPLRGPGYKGLKLKNYIYEDFDGIHFPDVYAGTVEWYRVDFTDYIKDKEGATIDKVYWKTTKGVDIYEQAIVGDSRTAQVKIALLYPGKFEITCKAYIKVSDVTNPSYGEQETIVKRFLIKVY